jgi:Type IV secretion-system coupling protein DNA-binding domain
MVETGLILAGIGVSIGAVSLGSRLIGGSRPSEHVADRVTFPREIRPEQLVAFARSISGLLPPWWRRWTGIPSVVLEVAADEERIEHRLIAPAAVADYIRAQLSAAIAGVRFERLDELPETSPQKAIELRLSSTTYPVRAETPASSAAGLLATLQPLGQGEQALLQWVLAPAPQPRILPNLPLPNVLFDLALGDGKVHATLPVERARALRDKQSEPAVWAACRIGVSAGAEKRRRQLLRRIVGAFHVANAPGVSFRQRWLPARLVARRISLRSTPSGSWPALLNAKEVAAFLGVPLGELTLPGLTLAGSRQLAPAADVPRRGRVLGRSTFPGAERAVAVSRRDSLRHVHVIGPTGVGKSTLLLNLVTRDMAAGCGVVVIDPKADLVSDVLDRVPPGRERDVILLDPTDTERPVGFNLLAGEAPEVVADQVVSIFSNLYRAFWGPRTDDVLRASLLSLGSVGGMSLAEIPVLLTDEGFRQRVVSKVDDYVIQGFWAWYESLSPGEQSQVTSPLLNKIRTFLLRRRLRNVIGQADSTFDMDEVLRERRILLVSLSKGVLGEDAAALLGSCVVARLWHAVQARAALPASKRHAVFAAIDEFQDYVNLPTSLADVLAQARAYGFGLTLAHQHMGQLPVSLRQAVLANARTKVVFQQAASDAETLAREFAPYLKAADLQGLGAFEAYAAVGAGSRVAPPTSIATLPPPEPTGQAAAIRALSRQRYGRDIREVEASLRDRVSTGPADAPVGRRRRP